MRIGQNDNLEKALFSWFKKMRTNNLPVNGTVVEEEEVAFKMRRHLEKFNLIYDETQEMKKQQTTIEKFCDRLNCSCKDFI